MMLSKEDYVEKIVRDILNGEMKLEDFVFEHFELIEKYKNTKTSLDNISKEYDNLYDNFYRPKPYKWGDFKDFTNAIDSKINQLCLIKSSMDEQRIYVWYFCGNEPLIIKKENFEENRFFPVQMANVGCE